MNFCSKKVLIVEDDVLLAVVEKRLIQKMGHQVLATVDDGENALQAVQKLKPDVILMDVRLNGPWDGIETVKEIRKYSSVPVIYLSGCSDDESRRRAEALGLSGFLIKPVQMSDLVKAFKKAFKTDKVIKPDTKSSRKRVGHS